MATATTTPQPFQIRWWVPGDWNAFFGLFTNVALNVIVLSGLVLGVIEMPGDVVFGRILPALGTRWERAKHPSGARSRGWRLPS